MAWRPAGDGGGRGERAPMPTGSSGGCEAASLQITSGSATDPAVNAHLISIMRDTPHADSTGVVAVGGVRKVGCCPVRLARPRLANAHHARAKLPAARGKYRVGVCFRGRLHVCIATAGSAGRGGRSGRDSESWSEATGMLRGTADTLQRAAIQSAGGGRCTGLPGGRGSQLEAERNTPEEHRVKLTRCYRS